MSLAHFVSFLLLLQGPASSQADDKTLEERLTQKYANKIFWVRDFRAGWRLRFDADGTYLRGGDSGLFGLDGSIHVDSVSVGVDRVELRGRRAFLVFESKSGRLEPFLGGEEARLEFARKPNIPMEPGIDEALITRDELSGFLPSYWKRFITGSGERPRIVDPKTGVTVPTADPAIGMTPKIIKRVAPLYPPEARRYKYSGSVVLRVIVDENGRGQVADLATPAGFGLDHAAIAAIDKWQFEPARQDGKPLKVYIRVRFDFNYEN
jgi:TonB family protein